MTIKIAVLAYLTCLPFALLALAALIATIVRAVDVAPVVASRAANRIRATVRTVTQAHETMRLPPRGQPRTARDMAQCLAHAAGIPLSVAWALCLPSDARIIDTVRTVRVMIDVETRILAMALAARVRRWRADRDRRRAPIVRRRLYLGGALDGPRSF